jgi:hypothetical protein
VDQLTQAPNPRSSPPGLHSLYGSDALYPRTCGAGGSRKRIEILKTTRFNAAGHGNARESQSNVRG